MRKIMIKCVVMERMKIEKKVDHITTELLVFPNSVLAELLKWRNMLLESWVLPRLVAAAKMVTRAQR